MKNKILKILANKEGLKDKKVYNALLQAYSDYAGARQVYFYQLGYTPQKLENLRYELKKKFEISDKEIALYVPGDDEAETDQTAAPVADPGAKETDPAADDTGADLNPILAELQENPDAQSGLKIRDQYPFLNDPNLPDPFKILVADKISAYKQYALKHAEALEASEAGEAEDKLFELAKDAIGSYELNQEIQAELDHYRDTNGRVLGKHPALADLRLQQEVQDMSEAELVRQRGNAQKSVNKYKDDAEKAHLYELHSRKLELMTDRLARDFNVTFDKR